MILYNLRLSSVFENIEVAFHIYYSWVRIRLHTENQLSSLPKIAIIIMGPGAVVLFLIDNRNTLG